jgi:NADH-quinone oxidoreductase subunit L
LSVIFENLFYFAWLCWIFPLLGVPLAPILAKIHPKLRDYGALTLSFLAALSAVMLIPYLFHLETLPIDSSVTWLTVPIELKFGVLIDPLSILMANVVAVISFFIMVYSYGYMKGSPSLTRWWVFMNFFIGGMLLLVISNNLLFLFFGWKIVGLCSWGLIGFYYMDEKKYWIGGPPPTKYVTPSHAGLKAMVMTSAGDLLLLGGILIIYAHAHTLNILTLYETASTWLPAMAQSPGLITLTIVLLLAGPVGKSAQFPFHEWLPEAMAGPGPVSALIHAATMVKSGVYLVARLIPIFYFGYWVAGVGEALTFFILVAWIGAITAFVAATQGMTAVELKKALAFSTVSQIGYMMLALGVAGFTASSLMSGFTSGLSHLLSHAMFKAALFLCAGSVIHTAGSIYMTDMGSLKKYMPYTWLFMFIASLSLMGVPPMPGFWSKDAILASVWATQNYPLFFLALITVAITAFYTVRYVGLAFYGDKSENIKTREKKGSHLGEPHITMVFACGILAVLIVLLGLAFWLGGLEPLLEGGFEYSLVEKLHLPVEHQEGHSLVPPVLSLVFIALGVVPSYLLYMTDRFSPADIVGKYASLQMIHKFFWNRWYMDSTYYRVFVDGTNKILPIVANRIENPLDNAFHVKIPAFFNFMAVRVVMPFEVHLDNAFHVRLPDLLNFEQIHDKIKKIKSRELPYNLLYVLLAMLILLLFILFMVVVE